MRLGSGLAVLLVALGGLASCGDDGGDLTSEGEETTTTVAEATTTERPTTTAGEAATPPSIPGPVNDEGTSVVSGDSMELELDDFYFAPTFVQADAGSEVTVRLHNEGSAAHTYTIDALGVDQVVQPGEETEIAVSLPADGPAVFYCRFHEAQGMQGAFFFE